MSHNKSESESESDFGPRVGTGVQVFLGPESESKSGVLNFPTLKLESESESHKKQGLHIAAELAMFLSRPDPLT